jgi:hypothetical protein
MSQRIAPSERKAQELRALLEGQGEAQSGGELLSALVRLSTERILQEALEQEQTEALGRARYERRAGSQGYRNGVRHEAQRWNGWKIPSPIQVGDESLGRSLRRMQAGGERAAPERYWCGAMQTAKRPGLAQR